MNITHGTVLEMNYVTELNKSTYTVMTIKIKCSKSMSLFSYHSDIVSLIYKTCNTYVYDFKNTCITISLLRNTLNIISANALHFPPISDV